MGSVAASIDRGERYFEVDVDISSSYAASGVVNIVKGATKSMVIDFAVLIEGQVRPEEAFSGGWNRMRC